MGYLGLETIHRDQLCEAMAHIKQRFERHSGEEDAICIAWATPLLAAIQVRSRDTLQTPCTLCLPISVILYSTLRLTSLTSFAGTTASCHAWHWVCICNPADTERASDCCNASERWNTGKLYNYERSLTLGCLTQLHLFSSPMWLPLAAGP